MDTKNAPCMLTLFFLSWAFVWWAIWNFEKATRKEKCNNVLRPWAEKHHIITPLKYYYHTFVLKFLLLTGNLFVGESSWLPCFFPVCLEAFQMSWLWSLREAEHLPLESSWIRATWPFWVGYAEMANKDLQGKEHELEMMSLKAFIHWICSN